MEAGRVVDSYGLRTDYSIEQSDAIQAYLQGELRGRDTWILLPPDQWPASWAGRRKPVCRLRVALYGHPDAGTGWEHRCDKSLKSVGFVNVGGGCWPSCYYHRDLALLLSVYVDDFKMAGPTQHMRKRLGAHI